MSNRDRRELFALSFVSLFLELALVRWASSYVAFIGFFSNLILVAAFVGLCIGILATPIARRLMHLLPVALSSLLGLGILFHWAYLRLPVGVRVQSLESPAVVYFGAEARALRQRFTLIPIEVIAGLFFILMLVSFLGIGQELGRRLERASRPLDAYLINLVASVLGVAAFTVISWQGLSPIWWLVPSLLLLLPFLAGGRLVRASGAAMLTMACLVAGAVGLGFGFDNSRIDWSPYYQVRFDLDAKEILVNGLSHQGIHDVPDQPPLYSLPHALLRESGHEVERLLIIGAGSGNDVAQALAEGVGHIDAVEIDPVILELGRREHPAQPYADPRVRSIVNDGRAFLRTARTEPYDAIIFALVDSLQSHSSFSSVRLESYLLTRESFADVRRRLGPRGVAIIYNHFRQGFVTSRIAAALESVFGEPPLVLSIPPQDHISLRDYQEGATIFCAGDIAPLRQLFADGGKLCLERSGGTARARVVGDQSGSCAGGELFWPARLDREPTNLWPTDDWPFLYLRERRIPTHILLMNAGVVLFSLALLALLTPRGGGGRPSLHYAFLGAGFMLLETRSVVQLALVYGATWLTTAVVVLSILVTATLATLVVRQLGVRRQTWAYLLLAASLGVGYLVAPTSLVGQPEPFRTLAIFLLVGAPIFFAGIVFGVSFARTTSPSRDFASNIGGVVLGAVTENLSLLLGFRALVLLALGYYFLSWLVPRDARR